MYTLFGITWMGRLLNDSGVLLARTVWSVYVAVQLVSFALLLPKYLPLAEHPCPQNCILTVENARALSGVGIAPGAYLAALLVIIVVSTSLATTMAFILVIRRLREWMALVTAAFVIILPTSILINSTPVEVSFAQTTAFTLPPLLDLVLAALQSGIIYGLFLIFPTGRFVPRWSWLLLAGFLVFTTLIGVWPELQERLVAAWPPFFGGAIACMTYRYWRVSTPLERQQTKWVLLGLLTFLLVSQAYWLPTFTPLRTTAYVPLAYLAYQFALPIMPITLFIAIQRYRLWDIDRLINRTLVYGALTLILTAVFVVLIIGLQTFLGGVGIIGQDNSAAIILSTLAIAALFQPARKRLQAIIDRRFYRHKYSAERTIATFSAALRNDVDLDRLSEDLISVVAENMRPAHISLWLRCGNDSMRGDGTSRAQPAGGILSVREEQRTFNP